MGNHFLKSNFVNEQQAVDEIAKFLVRVVGWSLEESVTDLSNDRHVVLSSDGEEIVNNSNKIYIGLRATSNYIYLYTYTSYTNISTNTGEVSDGTYGRMNFSTGELYVVADLERVFMYSPTSACDAYVGRINSYYKESEHPHPTVIKGGTSSAYDFLYTAAAGRTYFMIRQDGTVDNYEGIRVPSETEQAAGFRSFRTPKPSFFSIPIYNNSGGGQSEVSGELRGVWAASGITSTTTDQIVKIGDFYYYLYKHNNVFLVGPISEEGVEPEPYPFFDVLTSL